MSTRASRNDSVNSADRVDENQGWIESLVTASLR